MTGRDDTRRRLAAAAGLAMEAIEVGEVPSRDDIALRLGVRRDMAEIYHLAIEEEFEKRRRVTPVEMARVIVVEPKKPLSACEEAIFRALVAGGGTVVRFETLCESLGGISRPYLHIIVGRLRRKGVAIDTAWGHGYALARRKEMEG